MNAEQMDRRTHFKETLSSFSAHRIIVGISNTFWVDHTSIPLYQVDAMQSWAKLFLLPSLLAVNS
jgi:hypothetical protein